MDNQHTWYSPEDIARHLDGARHGDHWRARCPAHGGENPQSLSIKQGTDKHGNPCTLLKCFARDCEISVICDAIGIHLRNLFCIHPDYARATRSFPRAKSPVLDRLYTLTNPSQDDMACVMLAEMIGSDPNFLRECAPARATFWRLAQTSPPVKALLFRALAQARIAPNLFWYELQRECGDAL